MSQQVDGPGPADRSGTPRGKGELMVIRCHHCSKKIDVQRSWAGRPTRCPHCYRAMIVPNRPAGFARKYASGGIAPPSHIHVECRGCSSTLNCPADMAGKRVLCPKCNTPLLVPDPARDPD